MGKFKRFEIPLVVCFWNKALQDKDQFPRLENNVELMCETNACKTGIITKRTTKIRFGENAN